MVRSFNHNTRFLPLGSGTYIPECVSLGVPILGAHDRWGQPRPRKKRKDYSIHKSGVALMGDL